MTRWIIRHAAVIAVAIVLLAACAQTRREPAAQPPAVSVIPQSQSSHWVQDQRLRQLMTLLSSRNPSWPRGLPQEPEDASPAKVETFDEVANVAKSLASASQQIPQVAAKIKMVEADRQGFLAEARTLHDQADELSKVARLHKVEQMQLLVQQINYTCLSCHSRYRDFSGQLDSRRARVAPGKNPYAQFGAGPIAAVAPLVDD